MERITLDVARAQLRLRRLGAYVDSQAFVALAEALGDVVDELGELSGRILIGDVAITAGRDEAAGRDRYPLLEGRSATSVVGWLTPSESVSRSVSSSTQVDLSAAPAGAPESPETSPEPIDGPTPPRPDARSGKAKKAAQAKFSAGAIRIVPADREKRESPPEIQPFDPRDLYTVTHDSTGTWHRCHACSGDFDRPAVEGFAACHYSRPEVRALAECPALNWRRAPIEELSGLVAKKTLWWVADHVAVTTVGQLHDLIERQRLADVPGLSADDAADILDALAVFKTSAVDVPDAEEGDELQDEWTPETRALLADPAVNEHGVWVQYEEIPIPGFTKSSKCSASVRVAQGADGRWRSSYEYRTPTGGGGGLPSVNGPSFQTRSDAIRSACEYLARCFENSRTPRACDAVAGFVATLKPDDPEPLVEDWQSIGVHDLELSDALAGAHEQLGNHTSGQLAEWLDQVDRDEDDGSTVSERFSWVYRKSAVDSVRQAIEGIRQVEEVRS